MKQKFGWFLTDIQSTTLQLCWQWVITPKYASTSLRIVATQYGFAWHLCRPTQLPTPDRIQHPKNRTHGEIYSGNWIYPLAALSAGWYGQISIQCTKIKNKGAKRRTTLIATKWVVSSLAAILLTITRTVNHNANRRIEMSRESGDRYHCDSCGKQMSKITGRTTGTTRSTTADY